MNTGALRRDGLRSMQWKELATIAMAAMLSFATSFAGPVLAQNYPVKSLRLIVHSAPAGTSDILGRLVAQKLTESMGQQVVVENRAGASGIIGVEAAVKSPADGYTLLITQTSLAINPSMFKKLPYDALRDLAPVTQLVAGPNVLVVHPSVPATSVKGFIALAKAKPGSLVVGSPGSGTSPHLSAELFKVMAQIDMIQVQYKGAGQAIISLLAGEIGVMFTTTPTSLQYIKAGRLRALGVTTMKRVPALPDVPAIAESGVPGYESVQWFGILVPAGTPRPIVDRLHQEITRAIRAPEMKDKLTSEGLDVVAGSPAEFGALIKSETEKWARVIKTMGIKPE
jgi:tripartite-type tricarboxylate transporter receptor subunit TctC